MGRRDMLLADNYSTWYEILYDTNKKILIKNLDNREYATADKSIQ